MSDGPFREPQGPSGRARFDTLAPLVNDMGKRPRTSDPYFTPSGNDRGRGRPYLDVPAVNGGGEPLAAPAEPPLDMRPPDQQKWKPPAQTPDWKTPQPPVQTPDGKAPKPHSEDARSSSGDKLQDAIGSKSKFMVQARDVQRGNTSGLALIAGTAAGLGGEPVVKGMGLLTERGAQLKGASQLSKIGSWPIRQGSKLWQNNFDPIGINSSLIQKEEKLVTESFGIIKDTYELDRKLLDKLKASAPLLPEETKHLVYLKDGLNIKGNPELIEALVKRQTYFDPAAVQGLNAAKTGEHINSIRALELNGDGNFLTMTERNALRTRQIALTSIDSLDVATANATADSKWFTTAGAWKNAKRSAAYTFGTGAVLFLDDAFRDRVYGEDASSWESTAFTVPIAIGLGGGVKGKAGLAVLAAIGGHVLDGGLDGTPKGPSWMPESFKHFTAFDAVPLGLAFAIPSKGKIAKAGLISLSVLAGNGLESAFMPAPAGDVEAQAVATNINDKSERSYDSFEKAVQGFKELGKKNEIVLEQSLGQVLVDANKNYKTMSKEDKLSAHRTTAVMGKAIGEYHLENGTRLSVPATERPTYILDGMNLDMGGDALLFLQLARTSVKGSIAMTEILMGKQAFGSAVTKQEVEDLTKVGDKVNADIEAITGKHDIVKAMDKLKAFLERGTTAHGAIFNNTMAFHKTFITDINTKLGRNMPQLRGADGEFNPSAAEMISKLCRDQALARMAHAAHVLDHDDDPKKAEEMIFGTAQGRNQLLPGTNNPKGFDGALEALMLAERLAPDNPDLPELKAIANRLANQVRAKRPE